MKPAKVAPIIGILIGLGFAAAHSATVTLPPKTGSQPAPTKTQTVPQVTPSGVRPPPSAGAAPGPVFAGPTDNISKVANAIRVFTKSLTALVAVAPGQVLTQPVTISVGYISRWSTNRITQDYVSSSGNRFFQQDAEGDGKPREIDIDVTLSEPKPGGGVYTYALPVSKVILDPLYDVTISPLTFTFNGDCGLYGDVGVSDVNDLKVRWLSPDNQEHSIPLLMSSGQHQLLNDFAWWGNKVSASAKLHPPYVWFSYQTSVPCYLIAFCNSFVQAGSQAANLVPGITHTVKEHLAPEGASGIAASIEAKCSADVNYNITYQVHRYSYLELTGQP